MNPVEDLPPNWKLDMTFLEWIFEATETHHPCGQVHRKSWRFHKRPHIPFQRASKDHPKFLLLPLSDRPMQELAQVPLLVQGYLAILRLPFCKQKFLHQSDSVFRKRIPEIDTQAGNWNQAQESFATAPSLHHICADDKECFQDQH